jgi:hypothetical protein
VLCSFGSIVAVLAYLTPLALSRATPIIASGKEDWHG